MDVRIGRTATQVSPPAVADELRAQANELAKILSTTSDPQIATTLAYELGEIWTRVSDQPQAIAMFTRALQLEPGLLPARWALHRNLYRERRWIELGEVIARALGTSASSELRFEAAHVALACNDPAGARSQLAQLHHYLPALFELEQLVLGEADGSELVRVWLALADAVATPAWKLGFVAAAAHEAPVDAAAALARATTETEPAWTTPIARARVAAARSPEELDRALAALTAVLPESEERTAVRIRHTRLVRPGDAARAAVLAPVELPFAERLELAAELHSPELVALLEDWQTRETPEARTEQIARWVADSFVARTPWLGELLRAVQLSSASTRALMSFAEVAALVDGKLAELASSYAAAAETEGDVPTTVALWLQAGWLQAEFGAPGEAATAIRRAVELAPELAAVREIAVDVAEQLGDVALALALLRIDAAKPEPAALERAIRIASYHDRDGVVLTLLYKLVDAAPNDLDIAWRLESELRFADDKDEHASVMLRLVEADKDPQRRAPLLVGAARLAAERGDAMAAIRIYRDATTDRDDPEAVAELHELLRRAENWSELAADLVARARRGDGRSKFLEAAAILELALDSPARARDVYDEWHRSAPTDLTALIGLARTAERVGDRAAACDAFEKLATILDSPEAGWAWAASLVTLGKVEEAETIYFELATGDETVLSKSAAIVVLERAYDTRNKKAQANALELVAHRMADVRVGATLLASAGWTHVVANRDFARAGAAFAAALTADPDNASACLGQLLVASDTKRSAFGDACVAIAARFTTPRAAASLYLRAAHVATAEGRAVLASERMRAAFGVAPDEDVVTVTLGDEESQIVAGADPFAPNDAMLDRAALLARRIAMTTDPVAIREWRYELALAHELADQPVEAGAVLAAILEQDPHEWRAIAAVRRIARHLKHEPTIAAASYALARESHDRENRLQQLRVAIEIYDRTRSPFAFAAHRALAVLEPDAPEVERYLELARGDTAASLRAINARLATLETLAGRDREMVDLLVARAQLFIAIGQQALAIADLDAVLEHASAFGEALRLRAALAHEANDIDRAVVLWWRYLALDSPPYRAEVEALISQVQDRQESTGVTEDTHDAFDPELTKSDLLATEIALNTVVEATPIPRAATVTAVKTTVEVPARRTASIIRRTPIETEPVPELSEVGNTTARVDLSALLEQERSQVRPDSDYDLEITNDAIAPPKSPLSRHDITIRSAIEAAVGAADVPTIQTLTPLRVPSVDLDAMLPAAQPIAEPVLDARAFASRPSTDFSEEDSEVVMMSYSDLQPIATAESTLASLEEIEREIACSSAEHHTVALRCEAGRLALQLEDGSRAREHFDAALALDPHNTRAMRGLRRIAKREGDLAEVLRWLEPELAHATGRERSALARYRTDLLLALDERDLARIAVGEQLDAAPEEPEALVAQAMLCFLDDREDDLRGVLAASLASEPILRDGFRHLRALFGVAQGPGQGYESELERFASADLGSRASSLYELACHVEGADPEMAAAFAVRAQAVELGAPAELALQAVQLAGRAAPRDPFVARASAETARRVGPAVQASPYFARWARMASGADRAYAAAFAATADPQKFGRLWAMVIEVEPAHEYAAYRQREGQPRAHTQSNPALALDELVRSRSWTQLSKIVEEAPATDLRAMRFRAQVLHRTARATDATAALTDALDAWMIVLSRDPRDSVAQGAALRLAKRLGPASQLSVIAQVYAAATEPWVASSLAVAYAVAAYRLGIVHAIGNDAVDDPRRSLVAMIRAAQKSDLPGAARALADRARFVATVEAAAIKDRAAAIALAGKDLSLAGSLATSVEAAELRAAIAERKRLPRPDPASTSATPTLIYAAHRAQQRGDLAAAIRIYRQALARGVDPVALAMCIDVAREAGSAETLGLCAAARKHDAELLAEAERLRGSLAAEARATQLAYEAAPWRFDLGLRLSRLIARQQLGPRRIALRIAQLADDAIATSDRAAAELALSALALRTPSPVLSPMIKKASDDDPTNALAAMFYDATLAVGREQLELEQRLAARLPDPRARIAFYVRAGRTAEAMGDVETAMTSYGHALALDSNDHAALFARYALALAHHRWRELAEAAIAKAPLTPTPGPYYLVAGTALMDHVGDHAGAIEALQHAIAAMPAHPEVFARLRKLLEATRRERELELLVETRIAHEPDEEMKLALMRSLAEHHYIVGAYDASADRYRALVRIDPTDARAHAALVELASESGARIATAIHSRLALEHGPKLLAAMHYRLATYSEPAIAKRELEAALVLDPDHVPSLHALAELAVGSGEWHVVATAGERIAGLELDPALQSRNFYRAARAYTHQRDDKRARDMIQRAIEADPASSDGMRSLIDLVRDRRFRDEAVDQIANAMRARIQANPRDGIAYRMLSRALGLRREEIVTGTPPAARAAAELAILFGAGEDSERALCATTCVLDRTRLSGDSADKALFAGASQPELRQLLAALGDVITKQLGPDPSLQTLGRKDRLSSRDPVYAIAREIATVLGIGAINVYVSTRPHGMLADPTPPISLVLGHLTAEGGAVNVRFATGAALKLVQLGLAVPTRLDISELTALCSGVVRMFQPRTVADERASALAAKLERAVPGPLFEQLAPLAARIGEIDVHGLARDLRIAGLRAGFAAAGSVLPGLETLAAALGVDVGEVVPDPLALGLIGFALV